MLAGFLLATRLTFCCQRQPTLSPGLRVTAVLAETQSRSHAWYDQARAWVDLAALFYHDTAGLRVASPQLERRWCQKG